MIENVVHFCDPQHLLKALCGEQMPRFRTQEAEDITCQFCAYELAQKVRNVGQHKTTEIRRASRPIQRKLFEALPVLRR